jgi:hypothetical protein
MAKPVTLKKADGDPSIEVVIGQANWGTYKIKLFDKQNQNPTVVGSGFNDDNIADIHTIGTISTLNNRFLTWKLRSASLDPSDGDRYAMTVLIKQQGQTVPGGIFTYTGPLTADVPVKTVGDFTLLQVK